MPFVVSYSISTSNHNLYALMRMLARLYLIPFLHQTTTVLAQIYCIFSCILFHFYIKPQPNDSILRTLAGCILFHFYIKPQPAELNCCACFCCILFHFYIKPQLERVGFVIHQRCILFHFYIKPQHLMYNTDSNGVVSYSISTSNHNLVQRCRTLVELYLIPFLHQTTTYGA